MDTAVKEETILVSVCMVVYNHEKYIAQAIEGVLMQKTNFKYELIIGEDCSTDSSKEIIEQYRKKYPELIKCLYHQKNLGMKRNGRSVRRKAIGKYWAFCEGDDYWTDCNKLQKQVDFLENNPHYVATYHNVLCVDKNGRACRRKKINKIPIRAEGKYFCTDRMLLGGTEIPGQTGSLVCRNLYDLLGNKESINYYENCQCNGDRKMSIVLANKGDIYIFSKQMSSYRVVYDEGSSWTATTIGKNMSLENYISYLSVCAMVKKFFGRECGSKEVEKELCKASFRYLKNNFNVSNIRICFFCGELYLKRSIGKC